MNEVLREEKKYLLNIVDSQKLTARLDAVMMKDTHNGVRGYRIRSLYFDTLDDRDFTEKIEGMELRRKIRLRCYDPEADFAMLEIKQKEGRYQKKRSLRIGREDAGQLALGNYTVLTHYKEPFAAECYTLMNSRMYQPRSMVEYRRRAYIAGGNNIRVTLDSDILATEACCDVFSADLLQYPVLDQFHVVLEVKYNGFLFSYIKDLLDMSDRQEFSVSKYCLSRSSGLHYQL